MLTPEDLNLLEFNDVVEIYEKLNIDITSDIIRRIVDIGDVSTTTRKQLEILVQTNGIEVFNQALNKTSLLSKEIKEALKSLYEDVVKKDIQGYKDLYKYRNKTFKLSESQYNILNANLIQTNRTLKNFTNTIAFQSKQTYVQAIDNAYMKVVSGAFDYQSAISSTAQELANKGITLKDSLGRNVQLEIAVRRNVLSGIQNLANSINRDIEEELGCDGYEVTAHIGARPTHAVAQGKQYAITKAKAKEFGVEQWSSVKSLWDEYNCRHSYFGIILGISEPQYTNKELKEFKEATVTLNEKKVPYYEATQKQRQLENQIRKQKRAIEILENSGQNTNVAIAKLKKYQKEYNDFCTETGLSKDYSRTKVATNQLTNKEIYAINKYISSYSYKINETLRNNEEPSIETSKMILILDSALNKCDNYEGNIVRVLDIKDKNALDIFLSTNKVDKDVTFKEYLSFSDKNGYNNNCNVFIYVDGATRVKDIRQYNSQESELIYPRNSTFLVKNVAEKDDKYYILWEEINE